MYGPGQQVKAMAHAKQKITERKQRERHTEIQKETGVDPEKRVSCSPLFRCFIEQLEITEDGQYDYRHAFYGSRIGIETKPGLPAAGVHQNKNGKSRYPVNQVLLPFPPGEHQAVKPRYQAAFEQGVHMQQGQVIDAQVPENGTRQ